MIKEILLSLAVAAFSGVSSFVGSPKRVVDWSTFDAFSGTISYSGFGGANEFSGEYYIGDTQDSFTFDQYGSFDGDWVTIGQYEDRDRAKLNGYWSLSGGTYTFYIYLNFYLEPLAYEDDVEIIENLQNSATAEDSNYPISNFTYGDCYLDDGPYEEDNEIYIGMAFVITFSSSGLEQGASFSFVYEKSQPPANYTITKNLYNCSISSTPELPNTYQAAAVGQTFVIYGAANSDLTGDYGFTSSSLSVTGATASAISLTNEIGNTGYYRGCSFSVTLPANSFTISLTASRPTYSITSTLNNCTASPSVPGSYSGLYAEDFTFTAAEGYAFNSLAISWEFSANITAQEPVFSQRLYGSLYEKVTFRLVFENGNCEFRITAVSFNLDSYAEGYDNGYTNGYDRGHADGVIAGDSYGVWNWLKQAARTTGEFLSIPLLPGFSIGGLLTALAGLVIIWFFIKGFLFKS